MLKGLAGATLFDGEHMFGFGAGRKVSLNTTLLFAALLTAIGSPSLAQTVPPSVAPGAIERGLQQSRPEIKEGQILVPPPHDSTAPDNAAGIHFVLKAVSIDGATALPADALAKTYDHMIGRSISLADLYNVANAITALYAEAGYAISFGVVPAQTIGPDGRATISVVEGYVADIKVNGASPQIEGVIRGYAGAIMASRPLTTADLERYLLLANELPGVTVKSVFNRIEGGARGATRLDLNVSYAPIQAVMGIDNRGSRALGPWRANGEVTFNSPFGLGDALRLQVLQTLDNHSLSYGAANWSVPIDSNGTSFNLSVSDSASVPATPQLSSIDFTGSGLIVGAGLEHVLLRTQTDRLAISATASGKWLDTDIDTEPNSRDRIYTLDTALTYANRDGSGETSAVLRLTKGLDLFGATTATSLLRSRALGSGDYTDVQLSLSRLQNLDGPFQLNLAAYAQLADRGLLASEQCGYGGATFGRAFDDYEMAGDHCLMGSAELRYSPDWWQDKGVAVQIYGVGDAGLVSLASSPLPGEDHSETAGSFGLGLRAGLPMNITSSLEVDQPLGRKVAQEGNRSSRVFFSVSKAF